MAQHISPLPMLLMALVASSMLLMCSPGASAEICPAPAEPDYTRELLDLLGGDIVKPKILVNVTAWKGDATIPGFVFPELSNGPYGIPALQRKANFGIGISGGGLRATALGLGWLRGLREAKLLNKARYLGSASGGSFASTMVTFSDPAKLTKLLGPYVPPEYASIENISDLGAGMTFGGVIAGASPTFYQTFLESLRYPSSASSELSNSESAFSRAISVFVLNPLGLGLWNSTITIKGTRGGVDRRIKNAAEDLGIKVYEASGDAPFPLMTGNILDSTEAMYFYPFEMTPLYSGSPCNFTKYSTSYPKGGGLIEPLGFNADAMGLPEGPLEIGRPENITVKSVFIQPLVGRLAVSGGIMAVELGSLIQATPVAAGAPINSAYLGQPYYDIFNFHNYSTGRFPFGDGGYTDNQGLVAMLRRRVSKILLFYAVASDTTDKEEWSSKNSGLSLPFGRCVNCYTYLSPNITDELINNASQVFKQSEEFDRLFAEYQDNVCKGKVNVFNATLDVLDNPFLGVPGGWKVEVMIVMNAVVREWEDQLPVDTKELLNRSRTDKVWLARSKQHNLQTYQLVEFPFFPIETFRYDNLSVGAMMNFGTWTVKQLEQRIRDFIAN